MNDVVGDLKGRTLRALSKLIRLADQSQNNNAANDATAAAIGAGILGGNRGAGASTPESAAAKALADATPAKVASDKANAMAKLVEMAHIQDGQLNELFRAHAAVASTAYKETGQQLAEHIALIVRNNPMKTVQQIMERVDVQGLMHQLLGDAYAQAVKQVTAGSLAGGQLGAAHAVQEAAVYGINVAPAVVPDTTPTITSILGDLATNSAQAAVQVQTAAATGWAQALQPLSYLQIPGGSTNVNADLADQRAVDVSTMVQKATNDLANRSAAAASTATSSTYNDMKLATYGILAGDNPTVTVSKVWICALDPNSCGECIALHGSVLEVTQEFSADITFASGDAADSYDGLDAPPRHPYCGCVVILVIGDGGDNSGLGLDSSLIDGAALGLQQDALAVADAAPDLAPRWFPGDTLTDTARTTDSLHSTDLAVAPLPQFEGAVDSFKGCILGTSGNG